MRKNIFDYDDGDYMWQTSDNMALKSDGHMMIRMGSNMAMDMENGDLHIVSKWNDDEDDEW